MEKLKLPLIEALPAQLVTPERFGGVAVAEMVQLRLPETARIYSEAA
ncbi:MAG TPA: hypothetical protein VH234_05670 [Candidatus Saccharimonadales bacterium]|jgi:hypothetical protein|nr:hypothetical protein [Candidatus Saccharimonadales bacterium]